MKLEARDRYLPKYHQNFCQTKRLHSSGIIHDVNTNFRFDFTFAYTQSKQRARHHVFCGKFNRKTTEKHTATDECNNGERFIDYIRECQEVIFQQFCTRLNMTGPVLPTQINMEGMTRRFYEKIFALSKKKCWKMNTPTLIFEETRED